MAGNGPPPKRSDQRVRRNKDVIEIDKVPMEGEVIAPDLGITDPHPLIVDFWDSLPDSGQTMYWEPSDWQFARVTLHFLNGQVKTGRPSGQILATVNSMMTDLLVTEGARRRVRMEVERAAQTGTATVTDISVSQAFKQRFAQ